MSMGFGQFCIFRFFSLFAYFQQYTVRHFFDMLFSTLPYDSPNIDVQTNTNTNGILKEFILLLITIFIDIQETTLCTEESLTN